MNRDLNDVFVFTKVVDAGSFTAAGRALGLPTSTVSRRIRRLEEHLGIRLLQRTTRSLSLTDAGQLYYDRGMEALAGLDVAEHALAERQMAPRGRVRVAAPVEHSISILLVSRFLGEYPDVRVDLELTSRQVNLVEEGFDVAIQAGELADSTLVVNKLMDSPFQLVASPTYLARQGEPARLQDLSRHDCVIFGSSSSTASWTLAGERNVTRVQIRGRVAVNHLLAVRDAAVDGLGIALLPTLVCAEDISADRLRVVLPRLSPRPVPLWVAYPGGRYLAPAVRTFVDFVKTHFRPIAESLIQPTRPSRSTRAQRRRSRRS